MYDILSETETSRKNMLTKAKKYGMVAPTVQHRCWNCNKLLGTGQITEGYIEIKCPKCNQFVTVGIHYASLATVAITLVLT